VTSHTLYRDAAVLLSVVAPADLVRVVVAVSTPRSTQISPRAFTWSLPVAALALAGLGYVVVGPDLPWVWPSVAAVALAIGGAAIAFGGEILLGALPLVLRGRRPTGISVHRGFTERPAVLAGSTALTAVGEELIYRGLWLGLLVTAFGVQWWLAIGVSACCYALNHWYFGTGVIGQKFWSGLVYGIVYWLSGGAVLAAVLAHVLHNLLVAGVAAVQSNHRPQPASVPSGAASVH
jgi:hypothetical protein